MSKENYLQLIASFLIGLVLTIPFHITFVYATINQISVRGSDGVEGFARTNDFLDFNATASIGNITITREQVVLGANTIFDRCSNLSNSFMCSLRFPSTGKQAFEARVTPFTINLYKDRNRQQLDDSKTGSFVVDNKAPQVRLTLSKNRFSGQESIVLNYEATDFACDDASCSNKCVGLKNIEFTSGTFRQTANLVNATTCNFQDSISIDSRRFSEGSNTIFAKASDKFNQASNTSVEFNVDLTPPNIIANSFVISRKGVSLSTFSQQSVPVEVSVNISADDLNPNSVTADLTALNPLPNLRNAKASCIAAGSDLHTCTWAINLNPSANVSRTITINASDTSGNRVGASISKALSLDNNGPAVLSLATLITKDDKVYAKPTGNTVIAVLSDMTGISEEDVYLHVDGNRIRANNCSKEANFVCRWENVNFAPPKAVISIKSDTVDILLNPVAEEKIVEVIVDNIAPVLNKINISSAGRLGETLPELFAVGDNILVVANVTEENELIAVADFSKFIGGAKKVVGECRKLEGNYSECRWLTEPINISTSDNIRFNFSDVVGNTLIVDKPLRTLGLEPSPVPNFWRSAVSCSPRTLDRQLGAFVNQRMYCNVRLEPTTPAPTSTLFISPASCTGDGTGFAQNIETFNNEVGSVAPIIKITLKKDEFKIDETNLSCAFGIISRVGDLVTKNPEIEEANISIKFYNLPLGELEQSVKDEIDKAKKEINDFRKLVNNLNKFFEWSKKICQTLNTIYQVVAVLYIISIGLKDAETGCHASGFLEAVGVCAIIHGIATGGCASTEASNAAAESAKLGVNSAKEAGEAAKKGSKISGIGAGLNKFCDFATCRQAQLWGKDVEKFINEKLPAAGFIGEKANGLSTFVDPVTGRRINIGTGARPLSTYLDPRNSIAVAALYGCIPGIIAGIDKYTQIKCLYLDCLQNAVAKDGLPIDACRKLKDHATCKYIWGEVFAAIPYTALFDHYMGLIKDSLQNPFTMLGIGFGIICSAVCPAPTGIPYKICRGAKLFSAVGDAAQSVKNIIDQGSYFKIRQDYCSRLDLGEQTNSTSSE